MNTDEQTAKRILCLGFIISFTVFLLILRLFTVQVARGNIYSNQVAPQHIINILDYENTGDILDRNGIPFTRQNENAQLIIVSRIFNNSEEIDKRIKQLTGLSYKDIIINDKSENGVYIVEIKNRNEGLEAYFHYGKINGILITKSYERYGENSLARHIIGYIRKSDGKPVAGIEKQYKDQLHPGGSIKLYGYADARKQFIPGYGLRFSHTEEALNVQLTIDYYIQKVLEDVLDKYENKRYCGVVVDIRTGDIVALASRPQYNQFMPVNDGHEDISFLNMPFMQYSPGSVFKIIVAAAALEQGYDDDSLKENFAYSDNGAFVDMASFVGGDAVVNMARAFGIEQGIDISLYNDPGSLPSKETYAGPGIRNLAIGQGDVEITPLHMADIITTIVNKGIRKKLRLVKGIITSKGDLMREDNKDEDMDRVISEKTSEILMDCMKDVTEYGTGVLANDMEIGGTAGKTGTPEVPSDTYSNEHGWFAGYFPRENPKYAIVIMCREKGGGGVTAAPVFRDVARGIWEYEKNIIIVD